MTAAEIARGLTKAQREALMWLDEVGSANGAPWYFAARMKGRAFRELVLLGARPHPTLPQAQTVYAITPLGRAVAQELTKEADVGDVDLEALDGGPLPKLLMARAHTKGIAAKAMAGTPDGVVLQDEINDLRDAAMMIQSLRRLLTTEEIARQEAEARSADLERERDEARDELAIANDFIGAVRSVCKEATGGNTTFVDDDAARLLARAKDSVIALNATTAALTAARARIAEMEGALKPFADMPERGIHGGPLTCAVGRYEDGTEPHPGFRCMLAPHDFARARTLLQQEDANG